MLMMVGEMGVSTKHGMEYGVGGWRWGVCIIF